MDGQQQIDFIDCVRATRYLAANPYSRATTERPWRLSAMWRDLTEFGEMNFHFVNEADAQHGLTLLVEMFPDLIDLECSGIWRVGGGPQAAETT